MASLLSVSALFLLCLSTPHPTTSSTATPRRPRHHHQRISTTPSAATATTLISQACRATRFAPACESTLESSSLPANPTAADLIGAAIAAASANLTTARSTAEDIRTASTGDLNRTNAANNCIELLGYSTRRLSYAASSISTRPSSAAAWASAALLYQYDCWSALKYVNGTKQVDDAMWFLLSLSAQTSNALSLLFALRRFGSDVSLWTVPPQTERDGYWGDHPGGDPPRVQNGFPSTSASNAVVCKNPAAEGSYQTVQSAVDAAPEFGKDRFVIYIKAGVYSEIVRIPFSKTNILFLGDGMGKTVITGKLSADMVGVSTYNTATVGVTGDGFMARDLTFENAAGPDAHQAVAFRSDSDLSVLKSVEFLGHQDTLYAHSLRQYYRSCHIEGTVDFVFGNSAAVFEDCTLLVRPRQLAPAKGETNAVTAQGRTDPAQATGFVFRRCVVNGTDEYLGYYRQSPAAHKSYLGRPWKEYSRTVFVDCALGEVIRPEGWLPWNGDFALATLFYGEFESAGPGANPAGRVAWSSQIPAEHLGAYSLENFIQGGDWVPPTQRKW